MLFREDHPGMGETLRQRSHRPQSFSKVANLFDQRRHVFLRQLVTE